MLVYKYTNQVNGKLYIGITIRSLETRHKEHLSHINDNFALHRALKRYGVENFEVSVIDNAKTLNELKQKEKYWIKELNTYVHSENSNGYNLTLGGDGVEGRPLSDEARAKIKKAAIEQKRFKGKNNPNYGVKARKGKDHPMYGTKHSNETLQKQSIIKAKDKNPMYGKFGEANPSSKPVLQIDYKTGETINRFVSLSEATKETGVKIYGISKCCKGKQKFTGNGDRTKYRWEYGAV